MGDPETHLLSTDGEIVGYNLNKHMDILMDIDTWIVQQAAADLNLPRNVFAEHKASSFLRPLDVSTVNGYPEEC